MQTMMSVGLRSVLTSAAMLTATAPKVSNWTPVELTVLVGVLFLPPPHQYLTPLSVDIDECDRGGGPCHHFCTNIPGTYACSCHEGYVLGLDLATCEGQAL